MATKLKKLLGEAGGALDASVYGDNLLKVLTDLCNKPSDVIHAYQAVVATGIIASMVMENDTVLRHFAISEAVCGTAGSTTVQVLINGVSLAAAALTTQNTDPDPTTKTVALNQVVKKGDLVQINVSVAPTGGTGLTCSLRARPVDVE